MQNEPERNSTTAATVPNLIAPLPKQVREGINRMLEDNLPYRQIIQALGHEAPGLTVDNISNRRSGGYQDWLRDLLTLRQAGAKHEAVAGIIASNEPDKLHQTTAIIAACELCALLLELNSVGLRASLGRQPEVYARLLNAAARLSDGHVRLNNHRHKQAEAASSTAATAPVTETRSTQLHNNPQTHEHLLDPT